MYWTRPAENQPCCFCIIGADRSKSIGKIASMFVVAMLPKLMGSSDNLFLRTDVQVHLERRRCISVSPAFFHGVNSLQKAKQSQPRPKKSAYGFRAALMPARS
jgi:hypothetical protein